MHKFQYVQRIRATLETNAPMHIGGAEDADFSMALDEYNKPFLPGTSIAGACKAFLMKEYSEEKEQLESILGSNEYDSKVYYFDAYTQKADIEIRTGIRQDSHWGGSKDKAKYEIAYIAEGALFQVDFQFFAISKEERRNIEKYILTALSAIEAKLITFGSKTTNGAGIMKVKNVKSFYCDLFTKEGLLQYIKGIESIFDTSSDLCKRIEIQPLNTQQFIRYNLSACIDQAMLVKSDYGDHEVDAINMTNFNGDAIIPASTLKGVFRSYSKRILKTLDIDTKIIESIFGSDPDSDKKQKGQVILKDCIIKNKKESIYHRIKIDRFTGGTMDGAKFNEKPIQGNLEIEIIYHKQKDETINKFAQALIFLTMRDIAQGRIAIGSGNNIGFGRLSGKTLMIVEGDAKTQISFKDGISFKNAQEKLKLEQTIEILRRDKIS